MLGYLLILISLIIFLLKVVDGLNLERKVSPAVSPWWCVTLLSMATRWGRRCMLLEIPAPTVVLTSLVRAWMEHSVFKYNSVISNMKLPNQYYNFTSLFIVEKYTLFIWTLNSPFILLSSLDYFASILHSRTCFHQ